MWAEQQRDEGINYVRCGVFTLVTIKLLAWEKYDGFIFETR